MKVKTLCTYLCTTLFLITTCSHAADFTYTTPMPLSEVAKAALRDSATGELHTPYLYDMADYASQSPVLVNVSAFICQKLYDNALIRTEALRHSEDASIASYATRDHKYIKKMEYDLNTKIGAAREKDEFKRMNTQNIEFSEMNFMLLLKYAVKLERKEKRDWKADQGQGRASFTLWIVLDPCGLPRVGASPVFKLLEKYKKYEPPYNQVPIPIASCTDNGPQKPTYNVPDYHPPYSPCIEKEKKKN